jgi:lipoprotein-releasing system permease protein
LAVEVLIGWRYLKAKRRQTFISLISVISLAGVALGVMTMIVVLAVMTGFEEDLKSKILGVNAHVTILGNKKPMTAYRELLPRVSAMDGVISAEPFVYGQILVSGLGNASGAVLRGVDPQLTKQYGHLGKMIRRGELDDLDAPVADGEAPPVFLGVEMAKQMGLVKGDVIRLISPLGRVTPLGGRAPRIQTFKVAGTFESGMYEYDSSYVYVSLSRAQEFMNLGEAVTGLELRVDDLYQADRVRERVVAALGPDYRGRDWMEMNLGLLSALKLEKAAMFIILCLTVLVATFNIVTTLTMVVMEKTREIAVFMSMGATRKMVMNIFVFQGLLVGLTGTLAGLVSGLALCGVLKEYRVVELPSIFYVTTLPVRVEALDVALITISAVVLCFLATLYPAWQASRLSPVEALRYE